jgi:hypothetical protein
VPPHLWGKSVVAPFEEVDERAQLKTSKVAEFRESPYNLFMKKILMIALLSVTEMALSQNLMGDNGRIRKIVPKKKAIYFDNGIFHHPGPKISTKLDAVRHSFSSSTGYERVVFDFNTNKVPKLYGHISSKEKHLYLDLFNAQLNPQIKSFGKSKFVKNFNFYNFSDDMLTAEIEFKEGLNFDVFYLENPGRLVIDVKK